MGDLLELLPELRQHMVRLMDTDADRYRYGITCKLMLLDVVETRTLPAQGICWQWRNELCVQNNHPQARFVHWLVAHGIRVGRLSMYSHGVPRMKQPSLFIHHEFCVETEISCNFRLDDERLMDATNRGIVLRKFKSSPRLSFSHTILHMEGPPPLPEEPESPDDYLRRSFWDAIQRGITCPDCIRPGETLAAPPAPSISELIAHGEWKPEDM